MLDRVLKEQGQKGPLRYLESIVVEQVRLGTQPPMLRECSARCSPARSIVQMDVSFDFAPADAFNVMVSKNRHLP